MEAKAEEVHHGWKRYVRVGITALVLFALSTGLAQFLPQASAERLYSLGMASFQPVLAFRHPELSVRVVDISPLVTDDDKINRLALGKLLQQIVTLAPRGVAIDNDFTVGRRVPRPGQDEQYDSPTIPGQTDFIELALKLNKPDMPIVLGVATPGIPPAERLMGEEFVPLQASIYIPKKVRFDQRARRMIGPHWVPWEHEIPYDGDGDGKDEAKEALPSVSNRMVSPYVKNEPNIGTILTAWERAEIPPTWEVQVDVSTIPRLRNEAVTCTRAGELDVNHLLDGSSIGQPAIAIADQWVVLTSVERSQVHDRFDVPSIGKQIPGGFIHAAAIESLSRGPVRELTTLGTYLLDASMALVLGLLVEIIYLKFASKSWWVELRLDIMWTLTGWLIVVLTAFIAAFFARIVWYEWLNFGLGQLLAFSLKWLFHVVGLGVPAVGRIGKYLFLGSEWK